MVGARLCSVDCFGTFHWKGVFVGGQSLIGEKPWTLVRSPLLDSL